HRPGSSIRRYRSTALIRHGQRHLIVDSEVLDSGLGIGRRRTGVATGGFDPGVASEFSDENEIFALAHQAGQVRVTQAMGRDVEPSAPADARDNPVKRSNREAPRRAGKQWTRDGRL